MQEKDNKDVSVKKENQENEENLIDLKGSLEIFVATEEPELSQEEAIKAYREGSEKPKKRKKSDSDNDDIEDDDHLKRLKQELLASLEKVNKLAKQLFGEREIYNVKDLKVKEKYQKAKDKELYKDIEKSKEPKGKEREEWTYL